MFEMALCLYSTLRFSGSSAEIALRSPLQPTSTGSQQAFRHCFKHSATMDTYLTHVLSCASSILSSPGAVNSSTCLVSSDSKTISCRSVAVMVSGTFSCLSGSTRTCQSYAISQQSLGLQSGSRLLPKNKQKRRGILFGVATCWR